MAQESQAEWYGEKEPFETISREESWAESKTGTFTLVGKYEDLIARDICPGRALSDIQGLEAPSGNWHVRTCTISREDGEAATMVINAVRVCKENDGKPYSIIWQCDMQAVEKKLTSHPKVKGKMAIIQKWEETPAAWKYGTEEDTFYYTTGEMSGLLPKLEKIEDEDVINYCKAVAKGITTFQLFLPVITKTTTYLEVPGCNYDKDHVITGGTIKLSDAGAVGCWDDPDIKVSCIPSGDGKWFKSMDTLTENADGTATRTEQWTYTNDTDVDWIYDKAK